MSSIAPAIWVLVTCADGQFTPKTAISIDGGDFLINGELTYKQYKPESHGRLMNIRMVNSVFDDENPETRPEGFDAEANTTSFIKSMDEYKSKGILAFTLNLQGGFLEFAVDNNNRTIFLNLQNGRAGNNSNRMCILFAFQAFTVTACKSLHHYISMDRLHPFGKTAILGNNCNLPARGTEHLGGIGSAEVVAPD